MQRVTMTAKEVCQYIGFGYSKLLDLLAKDEIPHIKLGRTYYFTKEVIDKWLEEQQSRPSKEQEAEAQMKKKYHHLCG